MSSWEIEEFELLLQTADTLAWSNRWMSVTKQLIWAIFRLVDRPDSGEMERMNRV